MHTTTHAVHVAKGGQVAKSGMQQPNAGVAQGQDQGLIKGEPLYIQGAFCCSIPLLLLPLCNLHC